MFTFPCAPSTLRLIIRENTVVHIHHLMLWHMIRMFWLLLFNIRLNVDAAQGYNSYILYIIYVYVSNLYNK